MRRFLLCCLMLACLATDARATDSSRLYGLPTVTTGNITLSTRFLVDDPTFTPTGGKALTPNELKLYLNVGSTSVLNIGGVVSSTAILGNLTTSAFIGNGNGLFTGSLSVGSLTTGGSVNALSMLAGSMTATTLTLSGFTGGRVLTTTTGGRAVASSVTNTELNHLIGVTGAIQTQFANHTATLAGLTPLATQAIYATAIQAHYDAESIDDLALGTPSGRWILQLDSEHMLLTNPSNHSDYASFSHTGGVMTIAVANTLVSGNWAVSGAGTFGSLTVTGTSVIGGPLTVTDAATFYGGLITSTVTGTAASILNLSATNATVQTLTLGGNAIGSVVTSLTTPGAGLLLSGTSGAVTLSLAQALTATSTPTFAGLISGTLNVSGLSLLGSLAVTNGILTSTVSSTGLITGSGGLVTNSVQVSGVAGLTGLVTYSGGMIGNTLQLNGNLIVNGVTTLSGIVTMSSYTAGQLAYIAANKSLTTNGNLSFDGATVTIASVNNVNGLVVGNVTNGCQITRDNGFALWNSSSQAAKLAYNGITFNLSNQDIDFKINGDNLSNVLSVDASADAVGFGTSVPASSVDNAGSFGRGFGRDLTSSGNLTATDCVLTLTGAISATLQSALTTTRRDVMLINIGVETCTAFPASGQTLFGNTSLSIPAGTSLRLINVSGTYRTY